MSEYLVSVIDGTRARFFTLEQAAMPECQSGPNLVELKDLLNPAKELSGKELWANVKTGRNRSSNGKAHAYDDHRQNHVSEFERRFAQTVASEIANLTQGNQAQQLVLIAEPQILGCMRDALAPVVSKNIKIQELAKDLCKLKPLELHEYLATKNLLPARKKVSS